jgi:hypothetical protein
MNSKTVEIPQLGYKISADWYEGTLVDQILLVPIAWNSSRKSYNDLVSHIVEKTGMSALVLDYSGPFDPLEMRPAQHFLEVITAFDWLKQKYPEAKLSVMGTSYGGFMATQLTKYREFENLVLRVPALYWPNDFYSLNKDIDRTQERLYRTDPKLLNNHPLLSRAADFKGKTFVVVHEHDQFIPPQTTDKYIETFKADSYTAKGFTHSFDVNAPEEDRLAYKNAISDWLTDHIS